MADAQDLKSWGLQKPCGFESHHRYHLELITVYRLDSSLAAIAGSGWILPDSRHSGLFRPRLCRRLCRHVSTTRNRNPANPRTNRKMVPGLLSQTCWKLLENSERSMPTQFTPISGQAKAGCCCFLLSLFGFPTWSNEMVPAGVGRVAHRCRHAQEVDKRFDLSGWQP